ncbi:MAG: gas vesicle protein K [Pseudomonadota bacterium]
MTAATPRLAEAISDVAGDFVRQTQSAEGLKVVCDPERVERDLARFVLSIIAALRELMELQAIRRLDEGSLSLEEEERLSDALFNAKQKILDIAASFGLEEGDLVLDLGPLGRL